STSATPPSAKARPTAPADGRSDVGAEGGRRLASLAPSVRCDVAAARERRSERLEAQGHLPVPTGAGRQSSWRRNSRAPKRNPSAGSPARWTKCTEAYGPRFWRRSARYLSTGVPRPLPEDGAKSKPGMGGRLGHARLSASADSAPRWKEHSHERRPRP